MRYLVIIFLIVGCQKKTEDIVSVTSKTDPIYGKWFYRTPGSTSTKASGIGVELDSSGKISIVSVYAVSDGVSAVGYYRKSLGTFKREGTSFNITYNYETCDPVGSEIIDLNTNNANKDVLTVDDQTIGFIITMNRVVDNSSSLSVTALEDRGCDKFQTLFPIIDGRGPASSKRHFPTFQLANKFKP